MTEIAPKRRGRPPGVKNRTKKEKARSVRLDARMKAAKEARPKPLPQMPPPPIQEVMVDIVGPGEGFGERPARPYDPDDPPPNGQWAFVWPRPRGRPPGSTLTADELTLHKIWDVGIRQCPKSDVAVALGVHRHTLKAFFDANPIAEQVYDDARAAGQGSLRAELFRQALDGNTAALLFSAKHYLGMKDGVEKQDPREKLLEVINEFGSAISQKYLAFVDKEKAS